MSELRESATLDPAELAWLTAEFERRVEAARGHAAELEARMRGRATEAP